MAALSRRSILAGAAAIPAVIAVPALAAAEPEDTFTADDLRKAFLNLDSDLRNLHVALVREYIEAENIKKDAKLIKLGFKLERAVAEAKAFDKGPMAKANRDYERLVEVKRPDPWFIPMPPKVLKTLPRYPKNWNQQRKDITAVEYLLLKKYVPDHPAVLWTDESHKINRKRQTEFRNATEEAGNKIKIGEVEEKSMALWQKAFRICDRIIREPAHTMIGLQVKVKAVKLVGDADSVDDSPVKRAWLSAQKDIERIHA
jgi:hypothetical protein